MMFGSMMRKKVCGKYCKNVPSARTSAGRVKCPSFLKYLCKAAAREVCPLVFLELVTLSNSEV